MNKIDPPKSGDKRDTQIHERIGKAAIVINGFTVASLPPASEWGDTSTFSSIIYITDETGGSIPAFSDGTDWRRVTDRAIVS